MRSGRPAAALGHRSLDPCFPTIPARDPPPRAGHCRRLGWRREIRRHRGAPRAVCDALAWAEQPAHLAFFRERASGRPGYRIIAHARSLWHTPGRKRAEGRSGGGTTFARRLQGAQKPHWKADLNRSPRYSAGPRIAANTGEMPRNAEGGVRGVSGTFVGIGTAEGPQRRAKRTAGGPQGRRVSPLVRLHSEA